MKTQATTTQQRQSNKGKAKGLTILQTMLFLVILGIVLTIAVDIIRYYTITK